MRLRIHHSTTYHYTHPVPSGLQQVRVTPRSGGGQQVVAWEVSIDGGRPQLEYVDHHGNPVTLVKIDDRASSVVVRVDGVVDTVDRDGVVGPHDGVAPIAMFLRRTPLTEPGPLVDQLVADLRTTAPADVDVGVLHELAGRVAAKVTYEAGWTTSASTAEEALVAGSGVCQDHAHVLISAARALGVPARYVSGYLMMEDTVEQSAGHAWAEVHLAGLGWVGFDPSNGICPDERYVRVATGLDSREAAPVSGLRSGGGAEQLEVALQISAGTEGDDVETGPQSQSQQ